VKRVIVLGGLGLFGRTAAEQLRNLGIKVQTASRGGGADLKVDANDAASLRAVMRAGDIVVDAAGPFQARSTALIEAAIEVGFDVVDVNDNLAYAERLLGLAPRIERAGIRVLSGASTVSAVSATVMRQSGIVDPLRFTAILAPATRYTANAGAARSLVESVSRPVRVWRDGRMQTARGWSEPRRFAMPAPVGPVCGRLFESADALHLPQIWPTLRYVSMHVDTNTFGLNTALRVIGAVPGLRGLLARQMGLGTAIARRFGARTGGVGYEIEAAGGTIARYAIVARGNGYLTAVAPAVLAARAIAAERFEHRGLVPADRQVQPAELLAFLHANEILFTELPRC
jgi:hypothetical protein